MCSWKDSSVVYVVFFLRGKELNQLLKPGVLKKDDKFKAVTYVFNTCLITVLATLTYLPPDPGSWALMWPVLETERGWPETRWRSSTRGRRKKEVRSGRIILTMLSQTSLREWTMYFVAPFYKHPFVSWPRILLLFLCYSYNRNVNLMV